ncbi:SHOCT domain-containing protein [Trebonia kvetii]|uniref:SHOCT domain-containing protein n=1 Tax=Trebonia kvetii TaxID=2480626 RepID=A0A6P2BNA2_9ACTN|nr:SHOCT domain-containing protein [Trebonia kvetii]
MGRGCWGFNRPVLRARPALRDRRLPGVPCVQPWISHLRKLAQLHDDGVLSDAAYTAAKRRILQHDKQ